MKPVASIAARIEEVARRHPDAPALWAKGKTLTFEELFRDATRIATALRRSGRVHHGDRVCILANRSTFPYVSILATLLSGGTYVPLNPRFPAERNRSILRQSGATALIVDDRNRDAAAAMLTELPEPPFLLAPEADFAAMEIDNEAIDRTATASELAYLLFTSGSTGKPKGVPITHGNLAAYAENVAALVGGVSQEDRIVQLADLTFDISVHDIFVSWLHGASVYSIPENASLMGHRFVQEHNLTGWFSVPSTAGLLKQANALDPASLPSLRFTLFCGEALTGAVAEAWAAAAPNSSVFNLYGPTEATVAFTAFRYEPGQVSPPAVVALGTPFPGQSVALFPGGETTQAAKGGIAEICLSGSQVTAGYWRDPELNKQRFFTTDSQHWYRTGDLGKYDEAGTLLFAGRMDHQVKLRGFRVELHEIEGVIRRLSERDLVAVFPWPVSADGGATGCVAFLAGAPVDEDSLKAACKKALPDYMVPSRFLAVGEMPLNASGKVDYPRLKEHAFFREGSPS